MTTRTPAEKAEMIERINKMKEGLPQFSAFGDDNHLECDRMVQVIEEEMDEDQIYQMFDDGSEDYEETFCTQISTCISVANWLEGEEPDFID